MYSTYTLGVQQLHLVPDVQEFLEGLVFRSERVWDEEIALGDAEVKRILLLGDIHNRRGVFEAALRAAQDENCDVLVQVGDFWLQDRYWRGYSPSEAGLMWAASQSPIPVVVVDGNHEAWPSLEAFQQREETKLARQRGLPLHLVGSLWWADRGSTWTWAGKRFGALGGSASPDRWMRRLAPYRWDQETTTRDDLERLLDNAPDGLDVLVCHDAPEGASGLVGGLDYTMPHDLQAEADLVQALVRSAVDETRPALMFHGHWHQRNRTRLNTITEILGLAADGRPSCAAVLSIDDMQAEYVDVFQRGR